VKSLKEAVEEPAASILYVEDNFDNRILVLRILEAEGYHVLEAEGAREGMEIAQQMRPDLILVDISMPGIDGLTFTTILKSDPALNAIPVVAITANVMRGDRERSLAAGCDGYIQKPIDVDTLPRQVARFLQHSKPDGDTPEEMDTCLQMSKTQPSLSSKTTYPISS
jgi:two-component system cell cycle response regulator DivK